jgi:hypothetical protein
MPPPSPSNLTVPAGPGTSARGRGMQRQAGFRVCSQPAGALGRQPASALSVMVSSGMLPR